MRISNSTIINNVVESLSSNSEKVNELYEQVVTKKLFQNPSDDPSGFTYSMKINSWITDNEQYQSNIDSCSSWLKDTEDALDSAGDILKSLEELAVKAANGPLEEEGREAILTEVEELEKELVNIANTQMGDRYLFSGTATKTKSFNKDGKYQGDYNSIVREINSNTEIEININGEEAFSDALDAIQSFEEALKENDIEELSNTVLAKISKATNTNSTCLAEVGAKENRLKFTQTRLEDENINLKEMLSNNQDIDLAEAYTAYAYQEYIYDAALKVSSSILQISLVNYISS